jgi:hypothetical protein
MYRKPTSRSACWSDCRKAGFVSRFRARERSNIGIELKDMIVLYWLFTIETCAIA